jgi:hypothetical protein
MKTLKWLNKSINHFVAVVILALFYILGVGITAFFMQIFLVFRRQTQTTYWETSPLAEKTPDYSSPY